MFGFYLAALYALSHKYYSQIFFPPAMSTVFIVIFAEFSARTHSNAKNNSWFNSKKRRLHICSSTINYRGISVCYSNNNSKCRVDSRQHSRKTNIKNVCTYSGSYGEHANLLAYQFRHGLHSVCIVGLWQLQLQSYSYTQYINDSVNRLYFRIITLSHHIKPGITSPRNLHGNSVKC